MYVGDYWRASHGLRRKPLPIIDEYGDKDVLGIMDGFRENADSWRDLLRSLKKRGLTIAPDLARGDGALGFGLHCGTSTRRRKNTAAGSTRWPKIATCC